nr:MAG TPA: hypothetical protein [Bacteriophage sp.]
MGRLGSQGRKLYSADNSLIYSERRPSAAAPSARMIARKQEDRTEPNRDRDSYERRRRSHHTTMRRR